MNLEPKLQWRFPKVSVTFNRTFKSCKLSKIEWTLLSRSRLLNEETILMLSEHLRKKIRVIC